MRTRILSAAVVVITVCVACSGPAGETSQAAIDRQQLQAAAPVELAITRPATGVPVVSEIEAARPAPEPIVRRTRRERSTARPEAPPAAEAATPQAPPPEITLAAGGIAGLAPVRDAVAAPRTPDSVPAAEDGGHVHGGEMDGARPEGEGRGPIVIIRGGRGGLNDPCVKHPPRGGVGGVGGPGTLVNPRFPDPMIGDQGPRVGMPRFPRGGGIRY